MLLLLFDVASQKQQNNVILSLTRKHSFCVDTAECWIVFFFPNRIKLKKEKKMKKWNQCDEDP